MWAAIDSMLSGVVIGVGVLASALGVVVMGLGMTRRRSAGERA